ETRADLQHMVGGPDPGRVDDPAHRVRVVHEVLPECLGRLKPDLLGEPADLAGAEQMVERACHHPILTRACGGLRQRPSRDAARTARTDDCDEVPDGPGTSSQSMLSGSARPAWALGHQPAQPQPHGCRPRCAYT